LIAALFFPTVVLRCYLVAFLFWLGLASGSLVVLMIHHLTGGGWGVIVRRVLESSARTMPVLAALGLPLLLGSPWLFEAWMGHEIKSGYLNLTFFVVRAAVYFAIWIGLAFALTELSRREDRTADPRPREWMQTLSGPGLVIWILSTTFAAVDWVMSLEPEWYSSMFPVIFGAGQVLSAFAFAIVLAARLSDGVELSGLVAPRYVRDLGNLLLAFVMFWAYVSFSQFLLIWTANLPEEVAWYERRFEGGWKLLAVALLLFQFFLPFLLLLYGRNKQAPRNLSRIAWIILGMSLAGYFWQVVPSFEPAGLVYHLADVVLVAIAMIGVGGVWLAIFLWQLEAVPLVPRNDPSLAEMSAHG
jgi:hypothetical protein